MQKKLNSKDQKEKVLDAGIASYSAKVRTALNNTEMSLFHNLSSPAHEEELTTLIADLACLDEFSLDESSGGVSAPVGFLKDTEKKVIKEKNLEKDMFDIVRKDQHGKILFSFEEDYHIIFSLVGDKMLSGRVPGLDTIVAWFPDTMNRGNRMKKA